MEHAFWHARWAEQQIGFHQGDINRWLVEYWSLLGVKSDARVLVPLCGKSKDMLWLREQGHPVLGVELSDIACRDFFVEQGVEVMPITGPKFHERERDGIKLCCGDFFLLDRADIADVDAIYDRAALIALPAEMRARYVEHIKRMSQPGMRMLLVTLEYDEQRDAPPFAVFESEVRALFEPAFTVELLAGAEVANGRFEAEREMVYRLTRQ